MVRSDSQLMPDLPEKGRPSSAPLSVEDADRLADSFTPFWEDAGAPATPGSGAALVAAPGPTTANPGTETLPVPAVELIRKPVGKQTLLGIAPITIERPASAPPAAVSGPAREGLTQPLPPVAPAPIAVAPAPIAAAPAPISVAPAPISIAPAPISVAPAPISVASAPIAVAPAPIAVAPAPIAAAPAPIAAAPAPIAVAPAPIAVAPAPIAVAPAPIAVAPAPISVERPPPSEPIQSSPEVPGYAIAYTPKDPPSTPAVVIAPEAQSSPENLPPERKKREFSQTMPALGRSAPTASVAPQPPPPADDFNPYAPKKGTSKVVVLGLSGSLLLLAAIGFRTLSSNRHEPPAQSVPGGDVVSTTTTVAAAPTLSPATLAEPTLPNPTPTSTAASEPEHAAPTPRRATESPPLAKPKVKAKAKAKAESTSATPRPVTRAPVPEPSPIATKPASKGVIVRDAPF
jgi:hypothetical protein